MQISKDMNSWKLFISCPNPSSVLIKNVVSMFHLSFLTVVAHSLLTFLLYLICLIRKYVIVSVTYRVFLPDDLNSSNF